MDLEIVHFIENSLIPELSKFENLKYFGQADLEMNSSNIGWTNQNHLGTFLSSVYDHFNFNVRKSTNDSLGMKAWGCSQKKTRAETRIRVPWITVRDKSPTTQLSIWTRDGVCCRTVHWHCIYLKPHCEAPYCQISGPWPRPISRTLIHLIFMSTFGKNFAFDRNRVVTQTDFWKTHPKRRFSRRKIFNEFC